MRKKRFVNWPNFVTGIRLSIIPFFILSLVNESWYKLILFFMFVIGDFLDGYLARQLKQESLVGKIFDGVTDTIFIFATYISLTYLGIINIFYLIFLMLPRIISFFMVINKLFIYKRILYDTSIYRKFLGVLNFLLIFLYLVKRNIQIELLILIIINFLGIAIDIYNSLKNR